MFTVVSLTAVVQTVKDNLTTNWRPRTHRSDLQEMIYFIAVCLADCSQRPSPGGCILNCICESVRLLLVLLKVKVTLL